MNRLSFLNAMVWGVTGLLLLVVFVCFLTRPQPKGDPVVFTSSDFLHYQHEAFVEHPELEAEMIYQQLVQSNHVGVLLDVREQAYQEDRDITSWGRLTELLAHHLEQSPDHLLTLLFDSKSTIVGEWTTTNHFVPASSMIAQHHRFDHIFVPSEDETLQLQVAMLLDSVSASTQLGVTSVDAFAALRKKNKYTKTSIPRNESNSFNTFSCCAVTAFNFCVFFL